MLVEIDDRDSIMVASTRKLFRSWITSIDKGKVCEVGTNEWQARRYVVVKSSSKDRVVLIWFDNSLEAPEHVPSLLRHNIPSPLKSNDRRGVQRTDDGHQGIIVVQFQTLVCNLDPVLDDNCAFLRVIVLENRVGHQVGQIS